jgi:hypothetical protein
MESLDIRVRGRRQRDAHPKVVTQLEGLGCNPIAVA